MNKHQAIWNMVRTIPPGKVMSYGQIANVLEIQGITARVVGWAMASCPDDLPWWRVVNARGECSADRGHTTPRQRKKLQAEGVHFLSSGRVDMKLHVFKRI